jgi:hypothetical protein
MRTSKPMRAAGLLAAALLLVSGAPAWDGSRRALPRVGAGPVGAPRFTAPAGCHNYDLLFGTSDAGLVARALPLTRICPFEPRTDCRGEAKPGRSKLALKNHPTKPRKDTVKWSFKKGVETRPADFGDPTATTDYELCLYLAFDDVCWLFLHPDALAGAGWVAKRNGFQFKARRGEHPDGLRRIRLRWGRDRKTRLKVKGKGELLGLDLPPFPPGAEILVQLYNSEGECWSTEFGEEPARNDQKRFKDRSDLP